MGERCNCETLPSVNNKQRVYGTRCVCQWVCISVRDTCFCDSACCETFSLLLLLLLLFPKIGIFSHAISIQLWIESLLLSFPQILRSPSHITTLFPLPRLNRRKSSVVWRGLLKQTNCFERNRRSRRSNVFNFSSFSSSSPFETLCNILQSI